MELLDKQNYIYRCDLEVVILKMTSYSDSLIEFFQRG
jgi:hypothetical protein